MFPIQLAHKGEQPGTALSQAVLNPTLCFCSCLFHYFFFEGCGGCIAPESQPCYRKLLLISQISTMELFIHICVSDSNKQHPAYAHTGAVHFPQLQSNEELLAPLPTAVVLCSATVGKASLLTPCAEASFIYRIKREPYSRLPVPEGGLQESQGKTFYKDMQQQDDWK